MCAVELMIVLEMIDSVSTGDWLWDQVAGSDVCGLQLLRVQGPPWRSCELGLAFVLEA